MQFWPLVSIHVSRVLEAPAHTSLFHICFSNNASIVSSILEGLVCVCKASLGKGTGHLQLQPSSTGLPTIKVCYFFHLWNVTELRRMTVGAEHYKKLDEHQPPNSCGVHPHHFCEHSLIGHRPWHVLCQINNWYLHIEMHKAWQDFSSPDTFFTYFSLLKPCWVAKCESSAGCCNVTVISGRSVLGTAQQAAHAQSHGVCFPRKHLSSTQCVRASWEIFLHCFMPQIIA